MPGLGVEWLKSDQVTLSASVLIPKDNTLCFILFGRQGLLYPRLASSFLWGFGNDPALLICLSHLPSLEIPRQPYPPPILPGLCMLGMDPRASYLLTELHPSNKYQSVYTTTLQRGSAF